MKNIKRLAKKTYKKIPKQKIVGQAGAYAAKYFIGGPYLQIANVFYKKAKKEVVSYAGSYAYEKLLRSKYARENVNVIPMTIVSVLLRLIFNFLVLSKLKTGNWCLDFIVSVVITIIITLFSPFFYISIKAHSDVFMHYTDIILDGMLEPGEPGYAEMVKNRVLISMGIILIVLLEFLNITSRYVQELLLHSLITGIISEFIQCQLDKLIVKRKLYIGMTYIEKECHIFGPEHIFVYPYKIINYHHTKNRIILGAKPQRATIIKKKKLKQYIMVDIDILKFPKLPKPRLINIIDDYKNY